MTRLAFMNGLMLAFQTIRSHKLRAFLTVLGVIIGTGTIIASCMRQARTQTQWI